MKSRLLTLALFFTAAAIAQVPEQVQRYRSDAKGNFQNRRQGIMSGNRIRTMFFTNGEVAQWPIKPSVEWPLGSGHQYSDGYTIMVSAQVTAPGNAQVIHPLEISYREEMPQDPVTGTIWGFEPVAGYMNPLSKTKMPAMSNDPDTYPSAWPAALGLPADWNGQWYGYAGKGTTRGVLETFFVMDDSRDGKYRRVPYSYYPIAADSDRGGLGLRMEVRGMQFSDGRLQDVLFWNYTMTNIADRDYDTTFFGIYTDPGVGGSGSANDDASYSLESNLVFMWDHLGKGDPAYGTWKTGYDAIGILSSPNPVDGRNIGSLTLTPLADKGPNGVWPKNNEVMWRKLSGGFVDTGITNSNMMVIFGTPMFKAARGAAEKFDVAMILGNDLSEIIMKKMIAQTVHDNHFILPDSLFAQTPVKVTLQTPGEGTKVSGTVNVTWNVQGATGKTVSYVYASANGADWISVGADWTNAHSVTWNTALVPDGTFYSVRVITVAENGVGLVDSGSRLTINNSTNAKPEIRFTGLAPKTVLNGKTLIAWEGGDADGDSCIVNLSYKLASESKWTSIAAHIPASAGSYLWETKYLPNSSANDYQLKADIISNADTTNVIASGLSVANVFGEHAGESLILSKKTNATGMMSLLVVDSSAVTGHEYLLTFASSNQAVTGTVTDLSTGVQKLTGIGPMDGLHESKTFDGLRLRIAGDPLTPDTARTGWLSGTSTFPIAAAFDSLNIALSIPQPYDYQLIFSNSIVDTSNGDLDPVTFPAIPVRFSVKNLTTNTFSDCLVQDNDGDGQLSRGDIIRIFEWRNDGGLLWLTWRLYYGSGLSNAPEPTLGDVYRLTTKKPFAVGDSIIFTTQGLTGVERVKSPVPTAFELAQNYPNPFNPATTIGFSIPAQQMVDLRVYDIVGREVAALVHERMQPGRYTVRFDGTHLASGMYFYRLEAGSFSAVKKLMLVK